MSALGSRGYDASMSTYETIALDINDHTATLKLNRPEKRNALNPTMLSEIAEACTTLNDNDQVRFVLLEGAGKAFSVGFDLQSFAALGMDQGSAPEDMLKQSALLGAQAIDAIRSLHAISIASVHGYAIGGGFLMLAACDFRIADKETIFSLPEVDIGIPLLWDGVPLLVEELGSALTKDLVLSARRFGVEVFEHNHFLYRCVETNKRQETHDNLIQELSAKPALVLKQSKRQFLATQSGGGYPKGLDTELFIEAVMNPEFLPTAMAYMQRLKEKR